MLRPFILAMTVCVPAQAAELLMFESDFCPFCEKWNDELGGVYPKTAEGKRAPLRRIDNDLPWPDDIGAVRPIRFTPTFVLVDEGAEIGRVTGYNSEDFFWGLLGELIKELPEPTE
jgi:thioredoxin-related protein